MKEKRNLTILAVLIVIAGIVWYFVRTQPAANAGTIAVAQNFQLLSVENPALRTPDLERVRKTEYKSAGRNIFSAVAPPPPEKTQTAATQHVHEPYGPQKPIPPPPPPPVTLGAVKFFGYGTVPNSTTRRAFLLDGEVVYIVPEGEVLLDRFRILKVGNASLEFEELSSGRRGTAPLEEQAAAGPAA